MFHSRDISSLDWWDAREMDPAVQEARRRDCEDLAARQARIYAEMHPALPSRHERTADDFCRHCGGQGQVVDDIEDYSASGVTSCETCAGTGWR